MTAPSITARRLKLLKYVASAEWVTLREINAYMGDAGRRRSDAQALVAAGYAMHDPGYAGDDATAGDGIYSITLRGRLAARGEVPAAPAKAAPRRLVNTMSGDTLRMSGWQPEHARPGCMDHIHLPSLQGTRRVYRSDARAQPEVASA